MRQHKMTSRSIMQGHTDGTEPGLRALDGSMLPLERVNATGSLSNSLFEMSVEQHYRNSASRNIETVYTFPLMPDAVLLSLELQIGERRLSGTAVPVAKARQDYEEALEGGNTAALLEKSSDGLYTVSLGNLLAGETAVIRYRYAQPIATRKGSLRITIPAAVAPRYGNANSQLQPHQVPESDILAEYLLNLSVQVDGDLNGDVFECPTHKTKLSSDGEKTRIALQGAYLDRDIVLILKVPQRSAVYVAETEHGWIAYAPVAATANATDKVSSKLSLKMVIDCSGSMDGDSIKSARRGAMRAIEALSDADEFSITRFGNSYEHFSKQLKPAVNHVRAQALHYLQSTDATMGGTEMEAALNAAAKLPGASDRSDVLLVTDGQIWGVDKLVASAQKSEMRYFIVGVGSSPSHENLTRLAEATGGSYIAVTPGEDIEQAMMEQLARMRQPSAQSARLLWPAAPEWQTRLPRSLFNQEAIAVFAGLKNKPEGALNLQYTSGDGTQITETFSVSPWPGDPQFLLRVGTALRIQEFENGLHTHLTVDEVTQLAVTNNLVSQYTNYMVMMERAESEKSVDLPRIVNVKQMMTPMVMSITLNSHRITESSPRFSRTQRAYAESGSVLMDRISPYADTSLEKFATALNKRMATRNSGVVPSRIDVLKMLGIPEMLVDELMHLARDGKDERELVIALLLLLVDAGQLAPLSNDNLQTVKDLTHKISHERLSYLQSRLRDVVRQLVEADQYSTRGYIT